MDVPDSIMMFAIKVLPAENYSAHCMEPASFV